MVKPRHYSAPDYVETFGPEVAAIGRLAGFIPDEEQQLILDHMFGVGADGKLSAFEIAVIASRQNLKTGLAKLAALGWLFVTRDRLIVWSAHEFRTAQEAFRDIRELFEASPALMKHVRHIYQGNGDEAIEMHWGSRLIFKARTKGGGRGLSGDKIILDEAYALAPEHLGALMPTLSARPDPQIVYASSAGHATSASLRAIRDRGRAGGEASLGYFEWCAPDPSEACEMGDACSHSLTETGCGCDKPEYWQMSNPTMGKRISQEYIGRERRALPPEEFGRERMGWWDDPASEGAPFRRVDWDAVGDPASSVLKPIALAVEVAPYQAATAISVGGRREDGLGHGELIEYRPGTAWVVDRILELWDKHGPVCLILDPTSQAGAFIKELNERGFSTDPKGQEKRLHLITAREYSQACGALTKDIKDGLWRHLDQQPVNRAVDGLTIRTLTDAYAWSRKDSLADISPFVSLTLARFGFMTYGFVAPKQPLFRMV